MLCCCCRGCGRSGSKSREKPSQFRDNYQHMPPTPYSGYQPTPNPMAYRSGPSTATFDVSSGIVHEDSLPAMPSWDTAQTRRIEDHTPEKRMDDVEMGHLPPVQTQVQRPARNGYDQVPNGPISPTSPTYSQNGYFPNHQQHNADLGSQRMGQYNDYDDTPHSPAPTYHTNPVPATDRFMAGTASPIPYSYQTTHQQQTSYAPSSTQYQATDFASTHTAYQPHPSSYHSTSPPAMHGARPTSFGSNNYSPYGNRSVSPPQDVGNGRPPSLLQIGRKAVPGSRREV
jgi:hypothetical protein